MDDMISRREAIDALERKKDKNAKGEVGGFYNKIIQNDIDTLMQLPSAQPEEIALHETCTDCPLYDKDRHRCPRFNKVIPETLRELQSSQSDQRWIPCSERLPEVGTVCLACGKNRGIYVARLDYDGDRYYWTWLGVTREVKPIAWMPLPERYKHE